SSRISAAAARTLLAVVVVLAASNLLVLRYRPLPRQEDWRGSAAYVGARPSCARAPIPVLLPPTFGAASPFFRWLAQVDFYGRYDARPDRLVTFTVSELSPKRVPPQLAALWAQRSTG